MPKIPGTLLPHPPIILAAFCSSESLQLRSHIPEVGILPSLEPYLLGHQPPLRGTPSSGLWFFAPDSSGVAAGTLVTSLFTLSWSSFLSVSSQHLIPLQDSSAHPGLLFLLLALPPQITLCVLAFPALLMTPTQVPPGPSLDVQLFQPPPAGHPQVSQILNVQIWISTFPLSPLPASL